LNGGNTADNGARLPGFPLGRMHRVPYAVVVTSLLLAVLAAHVHVGFQRIRFRVVTTPQRVSDLSTSVALPDIGRLSGKPAAIILRVRGTDEPTTISVKFDDTRVTTFTVQGQREVRVDTSTFVRAGRAHQIVLDSDRQHWQLSYLEIANIHGHSVGALGFVIVPTTTPSEGVFPIWALTSIAVVLFVLALRTDWPSHRIWRRLCYGAATAVMCLLGVVVIADAVSQFKILLSLKALAIAAALLYVDFLHAVAIRLAPYRRFALHVLVVVLFLSGVVRFYDSVTGFTSMIAFGNQFSPRTTPALAAVAHHVDAGSGYDGQFYAQLALDPLLRDQATAVALDDSAYRSRRVLLPALAYVMGFGRPAWILQAYALLNVISWLCLAWLLLRWLPVGTTRANLAWAACMLSDSLLASVRYALLDGPSLLLLALAILAVEKNRHWLAVVICALSGTARETNVLGAGMLVAPTRPTLAQIGLWTLQGAVVVMPLLAWLAYLHAHGLTPSPGGRNFMPPFTGYCHKWVTTIGELLSGGWGSYARSSFLSLLALTTQGVTLVVRNEWRSPWWRVGMGYVALLSVLGEAVWEGNPGAASRVLLPVTFAFNILLPGNRWFWPLLILGNANIAFGLAEMRAPWFAG
jgi:hypothetical protein